MNEHEFSASSSRIYRHSADHEEWTPAVGTDPEARKRLEAHYAQLFGSGFVVQELASDLIQLDVHIFEPTEERNFYTLVTCGMSDRAMQPDEGLNAPLYAELLICLPPTWPISEYAFQDPDNFWPIQRLKHLARLPHASSAWLDAAHSIPNGEPPQPFASDTQLCGAIIAIPLLCPREATKIKVRQDKTVQLLSVLPIYREEMSFKIKHGAWPLFKRFNNAGITELLNISRVNTCRSRFGLF